LIKRLLSSTSLKANIFANFIGNGWGAILSIVFVPIYLKNIGAEGYGLIGIFASLQVVLSLLDSGLSTTLNKELARLSVLSNKEQQIRNLVKTLGSIYWIMSFLAGLIALGLSPILAKYWVQPKELSINIITYSFILLSGSLIFQFPSGFYSGGLLGLQRQVILNFIKITFATIRSVGSVFVLIFVSKSLLVFFGWALFINILQAFTLRYFLWFYLPKSHLKAQFDRDEFKKIWKFAAGMMGISLTAILLTQIDKIILSKILSLDDFGYYTIACSLGLMLYQIIIPLTQSYFPKFSNLVSLQNEKGLKDIYHQASQLISIFVLPSTLVLMFFSKELIFIWTKNPITTQNTWLITSIYAFGTGINGLMNIPYLLTLSYGWTRLGFYQNILFLILMIPLIIFLAMKYGAIGGAITWVVINLLYFFITPVIIHKKLLIGEANKWYINDTLIPLLASLSVVLIAKYTILNTPHSRWYMLLLIIIVGISSLLSAIGFTNIFRTKIMNSLIFKNIKL
jgi:O-antigen/teichoic acid export membrane protein